MKESISSFLKLDIFFCLLFGVSSAMAGGMEGGGGKTVVCRNPDGTIHTAEILDLYEGRIEYGLSYKESKQDWISQAQAIMSAAGIFMGQSAPPSEINDWFLNAVSHLKFIPKGTVLTPIDDSFEVIAPVGCNIEQTVNYRNDQLILVSEEIWDALSETQKAALLIHESIYRYLRSWGETNSIRSRHFNAYIVSGGRIEPTFPGNSYNLFCESINAPLTIFYATKLPTDALGQQKVRLQFDRIGGRKVMSRSYVDLNYLLTGANDVVLSDLLTQLVSPSTSFSFVFQGLPTNSLFEAGDIIGLSLWDGIASIGGRSALDESPIGPATLKCNQF
jgi:hypothetical protein